MEKLELISKTKEYVLTTKEGTKYQIFEINELPEFLQWDVFRIEEEENLDEDFEDDSDLLTELDEDSEEREIVLNLLEELRD